jgi:hypothetical protein
MPRRTCRLPCVHAGPVPRWLCMQAASISLGAYAGGAGLGAHEGMQPRHACRLPASIGAHTGSLNLRARICRLSQQRTYTGCASALFLCIFGICMFGRFVGQAASAFAHTGCLGAHAGQGALEAGSLGRVQAASSACRRCIGAHACRRPRSLVAFADGTCRSRRA